MIDSVLVLLTSYLAQAGGALVLALVLARFHRFYRRDYLLTWSWSWWALCVYLVSAAAAVHLRERGIPVTSPERIAVSSVYLVAGYWQVAWLLFGTYEVTTERRLRRRIRLTTLSLLAALGLASVAASLTVSEAELFLVRLGVRPLCLALAFLGASYGLWHTAKGKSGLGRRLVTFSFFLYGLHQLHYLVLIGAWLRGAPDLGYFLYLAPFDFLFLATMGLGMVIWLLEEERRQMLAAAARIEHLAFHDALTDLPNRNLLLQSLGLALRRARRRQGRLAVLFLNIDRFKTINDSLGHGSGDELVREIAARLRSQLRGNDLLSRVAADEFALLIPTITEEAEVNVMAERVLGLIRRPFTLGDRELHVTASLGVSRFPDDGSEAEELLRRAEAAMARAKEQGRDQFQIYAPGMEVHSLDRLSLENDLRKALDHDELELFYQPIVGARGGEPRGVEALLRWRHPERGLLSPAQFLWLAEVTGLSAPFDLWVLRTACQEVRGWYAGGLAPVRVAVNLSARSFQNPDLPARVGEILIAAGLPAPCLELEITETLAMQNAEAALTILRGLKDLGARLSIDDFGTGYSSLSYLTDFPIDTLKVDRSFVTALGTRRGDEVAAAVIALAHSLEIGVVAEGVEEEEQRRILEEKGCDELQGYLFSQPLPAAECLAWVQARFP